MRGARAGDFSWTHEAVSPAVNYANRQTAVRYAPTVGLQGQKTGSDDTGARPASSPGSSAPKITRVHALRSYPANVQLQTSLCCNDMNRCVPVSRAAMTTRAFNGLDASKPLYMVHRVNGEGPLASPIFIKASVIVWYQ